MNGKLLKLWGLAFSVSILLLNIPASSKLQALGMEPCHDQNRVSIVYLRGSGEQYNGQFYELLKPALNKNLNPELYELLELKPSLVNKSMPDYKATAVVGDFDAIYTGGAAIVSGGSIGKYKPSVESGVNLLTQYLKELNEKENECTVLIGYSQGAHVIGDTLEALAKNNTASLRNILYVALAGDPKMDLRGEGLSLGKNIPWYRGNAIPAIHGGSLGSRIPYIPKDAGMYVSPVGSWCYDDDFVCTENYLTISSSGAHGKYPERAFSQMSLEIANAIGNPSGVISKETRPKTTCGRPKQDIVVLLDTSPTMRRDAKIFTNTALYDPYNTSPLGVKLPPRTAGQMIVGSGCGDTRVAVVGYGGVSEGEPHLLLDFTNDASAYDTLLNSLYQPISAGRYERPQFREAALTALSVSWREDANRSIYAITSSTGSGPEWSGGTSNADVVKRDAYKKDNLTQQLVGTARSNHVAIFGLPVQVSYDGFGSAAGGSFNDARSYLNMFGDMTGGYNWNLEWPNYGGYNFKYARIGSTLSESFQRQEKLEITTVPIQGKVGEVLQSRVLDNASLLAAAKLRGDSISYKWYVDCKNKTVMTLTDPAEIKFTASEAQECDGTVVVEVRQGSGAGCYSGCPEPFPPYMTRSVPMKIAIKPANYIPKIPATIKNLSKIMYDDRVEYSWDAALASSNEDMVYIARDSDGAILSVSTARQITVTESNYTDPVIEISAAGTDGVSASVSSNTAQVVDKRQPQEEPQTDTPSSLDTGSSNPPESVTTGDVEDTSVTSTVVISGGQESVPASVVAVAVPTSSSHLKSPQLPIFEPHLLGDSTSVSKETFAGIDNERLSDKGKGWLRELLYFPLFAVLLITLLLIKKSRKEAYKS